MALTLWRFTDSKAGHDTQSKALCNAIAKLKSCQIFDLPTSHTLNCLEYLLLNEYPAGKKLPDPDLIIGAGHGTHLSMLAAHKVRQGKIVVLMKPSLPLAWFDLCIIPKHDSPPINDNVIITQGALSAVQYNPKKMSNTGLILIGGPSDHFNWNSSSVINQIKQIIENSDKMTWRVADSPRTPEELLDKLEQQLPENTEILHYPAATTECLHNFIFTSETIWVSKDSVSMIYESLSSGARVGLLEIKEKKESRVNRAIKLLVKENRLTSFSKWMISRQYNHNDIKINEAERCAKLIQERGLLD